MNRPQAKTDDILPRCKYLKNLSYMRCTDCNGRNLDCINYDDGRINRKQDDSLRHAIRPFYWYHSSIKVPLRPRTNIAMLLRDSDGGCI